MWHYQRWMARMAEMVVGFGVAAHTEFNKFSVVVGPRIRELSERLSSLFPELRTRLLLKAGLGEPGPRGHGGLQAPVEPRRAWRAIRPPAEDARAFPSNAQHGQRCRASDHRETSGARANASRRLARCS